jgi:hypothetical protein
MIGDYSTSFDWSRNGNAFASTRGYPNLAVFLCEPACNSDQVRGETGVQN